MYSAHVVLTVCILSIFDLAIDNSFRCLLPNVLKLIVPIASPEESTRVAPGRGMCCLVTVDQLIKVATQTLTHRPETTPRNIKEHEYHNPHTLTGSSSA